MRSSSLLLTVLLCIFILNSNAKKYKILMFSPKFAHSHVTYMGKIADTLVEAGHDVTVFLPEQSKNVKTNGTKLAKIIGMPAAPKVLKQFQGDVYFENTWTAGTQNPLGQKPLMSFVADTMAMQCEELMKHDEIFEYFKNENFDLGIVEIFDMCGVGFFEAIGLKKTVVTSSSIIFDGMAKAVGVHSPPSYVSSNFSPSGEELTLFDRIKNMITMNYISYGFYDNVKNQEETQYREKFGADFPEFDELIARGTFVLINSEPIIDFARPTLNKVIPIGGIGVPTPQPLDNFWEGVVSQREKTVLMSFGSFAQSYVMPNEMKEAVKKTMRRFPDVTFIWKYEKDEDNIGKDVPNLVTSSWVPQNDLLNHSKLAAFITHAGMNSLIEASHRGVPVVTIPLFGEQLRNGKMMKKVGSSVLVNKEQLFDSDVLETAIKEVLTNPTYAETAKRVSRMIAARPTSIKEYLLKHVEFAAEFGQMPTFDPYGRKLNWFLYFSLDVISLGVIALCSSVVTIWMVLRTMVSKISVSKSKSE